MLKRFKSFAVAVVPILMMTFAGCSKEKGVVILSAVDTPNAQAVGEMYAQALEAAKYRVERRFSLPQAQGADEHALHHALRDGHIDIYVGYTGDETFMLDKEPATNQYTAYDDLKEYFEEEGITLLEPIPANNAYTLVVLREKAKGDGAKTSADNSDKSSALKIAVPDAAYSIKTFTNIFDKSSTLKIAVTDAFKNGKEGFGALEKSYGAFSFAEVVTVEDKDLFAALESGKADVAVARSNDGRLSDSKFKALSDNYAAFVPQIITPIVKKTYIDNNPEIREVLNKVSATLNDKEAIELNKQLTVLKKEPKEVAKQYLKDIGK